MPGEHQVDCVDDVVQEIGLICGVAVGASENHPIGAAGSEYLHRSRSEIGKQTASGATVSRRLAVQHTFVDRPMVAGLDSPIELRVALRLEDRIAIKGGGEIQQSAWAHQGTEAWQGGGHIYQVEKGLPISRPQARRPCSRAMKCATSIASVSIVMCCPSRRKCSFPWRSLSA